MKGIKLNLVIKATPEKIYNALYEVKNGQIISEPFFS